LPLGAMIRRMRLFGIALVFAVLSGGVSACGGSVSAPGAANSQSSGGVPNIANSAVGGAGNAQGGSSSAAGGSANVQGGSTSANGGSAGAIGGTASSAGGTASSAGGSGNAGGQSGATCDQTSTSTLSGASLQFVPPLRCMYTLAEAAAGISIAYELVISQDISNVVAQAQSTCVQPAASGLYVLERLSGNGQSYCLCDNGLCTQPLSNPVTLPAGTYAATFHWDGVNWYGPSDTNNPKGPAFPAGTYLLELSATGTRAGVAFQVYASLPLTLVP
jgi:hypothetical protein